MSTGVIPVPGLLGRFRPAFHRDRCQHCPLLRVGVPETSPARPLAIMDEVLKGQFERVEAALNTLIESITSYNPSPQAAQDLVVADDDLSRGLEQRESTTVFL